MAECLVVKTQPTDIDMAIDWLMRLQRPSVSPADWLAFDAWLSASEHHAQAYDAALALDLQLAGYEPEITQAAPLPFRQMNMSVGPKAWRWPVIGATVASLLIGAGLIWQSQIRSAPASAYSTAIGSRKTVVLADGSRIDLNTASQLTVDFDRSRRQVRMKDAEAYFDVAKDPRRPFVIEAGQSQIRVVGTAFDVKNRDGQLVVSVERGIVDVQPTPFADAKHYRLRPGQALAYNPSTGLIKVSFTENGEASGWRTGRLIYRDQPLSVVVADLNRQFKRPIRLGDTQTGRVRLSGVLMIDTQAAMLKRLSALLPIKASDKGNLIVIEAR
jgi:transmembrane sensor